MAESVQQLAARALAAGPADRTDALRHLARAGDPAAALAALQSDARLGLEFLARLPDPVPAGVVRPGLAMVADAAGPLEWRLAAAGKLLAVADSLTVTAIVQPLVAGMTAFARLSRLYDLQRRVEKCDPLDKLVAKAEAETVEACPQCRERLPRPALVAHLWAEHRLPPTGDPRPTIDAAVAAASADPSGAATDTVYQLTPLLYPLATPVTVFQTLARGSPDPTQAERLKELAAEKHCALCPECLSAVPDAIPPLPPPADVGHGRVSADGFLAAVEDKPFGRTVTLDTPAGPRDAPDTERLPPALAAVLYALPVFGVGLLVALVLPGRVAHPLLTCGLAVGAGWLAYAVLRSTREPLPDATDEAVTLAWRELVPGVGRSPAAVRFLTRLCRGSVGLGDPGPRAGRVHELAEQAAVLDRKGEAYSQLAAAAAVLRASDTARIGREPVSGYVELFRPFAAGRASAGFAEAAAEIILADVGLAKDDLLRLGVGVTAVLFDAGLGPGDVLLLNRFCPWLAKLLPAGGPEHLAGLYAVWQLAAGQKFRGAGPATTIFDLAANNPAAARRLLAAHPDTLLRADLGDAASEAVGAVVLTSSGLAVGGLVASDPDERIESEVRRLRLGDGVLTADAPIPDELPERLRDWLIWRAGRLLPKADAALARPSTTAPSRLAARVADCPLCGVRCVWRAGRYGTQWQAVAGA